MNLTKLLDKMSPKDTISVIDMRKEPIYIGSVCILKELKSEYSSLFDKMVHNVERKKNIFCIQIK